MRADLPDADMADASDDEDRGIQYEVRGRGRDTEGRGKQSVG